MREAMRCAYSSLTAEHNQHYYIVAIVVCSESYYYSIGEADNIISISMGAGGLEIWGGGCKLFARMCCKIDISAR